MRKYILFTILIASGEFASCQFKGKIENSYGAEKNVQLSFLYPIGSNGINSYSISNHLSVNILMGYNGGVNGIEMGGFLNINESDVSGIQLAGFGNLNRGEMKGIQLSGFANMNEGNSSGIQGSGFVNTCDKGEGLIQLAGFSNMSNDLTGMQAAGFMNMAKNVGNKDSVTLINNLKGKSIQLSGFANIADNIDGIQGAGFMNVAKNVNGLQLAGFINICDSINGIPIAPFSYVKYNGCRKMAIWSSETFYVNASYKMGVEKLYTIFNIGYRPNSTTSDWSFGIGAGTSLSVKNDNYFDLELIQHTIIEQNYREFNHDFISGTYSQIKTSFRHKFSEHLQVFAGPSFNMLYLNNTNGLKNIYPAWAISKHRFNRTVYSWFGFNAGFQF